MCSTAPAIELVRPALSRAVARGIPGAREVELAGADHLWVAGDQDAMLGEIEEFVTGRPAAAVSDRVLATVLFNDIVRSTDRAAELGDRRWRELLGQYRRLIERELVRFRGRLVKWTGRRRAGDVRRARPERCGVRWRSAPAQARSGSRSAPASIPASAR